MSDSMTVEELKVLVDAELDGFRSEMNKMKGITDRAVEPAKKSLSGLKSMLASLGKIAAIGYLSKKIYDFGKYSIQTALEVSAAMNQIKRTMGESTQSFLKWSKGNALAFNLSQADAIKYGAVFSNLFSGFIKDQEQLTGYTVQMLKTSAVVSSATGRTMEDVMNRIRSGMLGSTEAIEDLGINVNIAMIKSTEAFKRMSNGMNWDQLDFQTQQAIRMMAIMEQASVKFGNTLMEGPTTSLATFTALMKNAALNIGNAFLPVIQAVTPILVGFAKVLNTVTGYLATFMQLLFGKKASASGSVSNGINDASKNVGGIGKGLDDANKGAGKLGKGLGGAGKQAKALKKELLGLMGFDEINLLNKNKDNDSAGGGGGGKGGSGGGAGGGGGISLPKVSFDDNLIEDDSSVLKAIEKIKKALEYLNDLLKLFQLGFKDVFKFDGLDKLQNSLKGIRDSIIDIFSDGQVFKAVDRFNKTLVYALGQVTGALGNVILGIAIFIAESFNKSLKDMKLDIKGWLIKHFNIGSEINISIGNLAKNISDIFYDTITSEGATKIGASFISAFLYALGETELLCEKMIRDILKSINKIISDNKEALTNAFKGTFDALAPAFESLKNIVRDSLKAINGLYDEHINPLVDSITETLSKIVGAITDGYNTYILPILTSFGEKFKDLYENYIAPCIDSIKTALGEMIDVLKLLWEEVLDPLFAWIAENIIPVLEPVIKFIVDGVISNLKFIFQLIKNFIDTLSGIIEFIVGVFTGDWKKCWDAVKKIFTAIWDAIYSFIDNILTLIWKFIEMVFNTILKIISTIVKGIWNVICDVFGTVWNFIKDIFTKIGNFISNIWHEIKTTISNLLSNIFGTVKTKCSDIYNSVKEWFTKIPDKIKEIWTTATDYLKNINLFQIGKDIISGLINGIGSMARAVWDKARSIASGIGKSIKGFFGINSPSKLMAEYGSFIGQGLYIGIDKEEDNVLSSAKGLSSSVIKGLNSNDYDVNKNIKIDIFADLKTAMSDMITTISSNKKERISGDIIVQIGDTEFGRFAINKINEEQERAGMTLLKI